MEPVNGQSSLKMVSVECQFPIERCRRHPLRLSSSSSSPPPPPPTPTSRQQEPSPRTNTHTSQQANLPPTETISPANHVAASNQPHQRRHFRRDSCGGGSCLRKAGELGKHPIHIASTMRAATGRARDAPISPTLLVLVLIQLLAYGSTSGLTQPDVGQSLDGHQILRGLGSRLIQQLATLPDLGDRRWTRVPSAVGPSADLEPGLTKPVTSPQQVSWWRRGLSRLEGHGGGAPIRRQSPLNTALARLQSRIGARNSIRVHNAFRDLAWRLLASLSMPTPIIYEIRRQHLYSPEEDEHNDLLHNRNTSKTIRSKRLLLEPAARAAAVLVDNLNPLLLPNRDPYGLKRRPTHKAQRQTMQTTSRNDDDDEPDNIRDRLRSRLEDLVNLSRRSLFGRVIRLPSILPFKRQVQVVEPPARHRGRRTRRARLLRRRSRRKKEANDRQMISINGKQYYVNDDGELKEWNKQQQ